MDLMQKARARMLLKHVFFATLTLSSRWVPDKSIPTAATDMRDVFYNPDFIEGLKDVELVQFVIAHEISHIMFKHGLRLQGRNHRRWNIACDFAINLILKESGFKVWEHALCDDKYKGMSAEQIYAEREKAREEARKSGDTSKPQKGKPGQGTPDHPSFGEGNDPNGIGDDLIEPKNMDAAEKAQIEQTIQQRVAQAANIARIADKVPAGMERIINGILNPPLPWRALLREYATSIVMDDENWVRRNRRFSRIVLPGRHSERLDEVVVIGDTSGSVGAEELKQVSAEITEIVEEVKPQLTRVVWADAKDCNHYEEFEPGEPVVIHPRGGGGTDMRLPLKYVERFEPRICILVTDGFTPWPNTEPPYPLIVVLTTNAPCPIGRVVRMKQ